MTHDQKVAFGVGGGLYLIIALCSLFGFIGSIVRNVRAVRTYSIMSYILFALTTAVSVLMIINLFKRHPNGLCTPVLIGNGPATNCTTLDGTTKALIVVMIVLSLFLQLYICIVIRRYVQQLEEEQAYGRSSKYPMGTAVPAPVTHSYGASHA